MTDNPRGLLRRHRDFRHVSAADAFSTAGSWLSALAVPLLALLTLDATPMQVAALKAAETTAWLALGLLAGAWLDRMRCRGVLIAADVARAVIVASVPIAYLAGVLTLAQLFVVALLTGVGTVFFDIAGTTYLPRILAKDDLVEANARLSTNTSVAAVLASGGGGFVIQWLSAPFAIAVNAVSFLLSAVLLRGIRSPERPPSHSHPPHLRRDIAEGWRFVVRHPVLRPLAGFNACTIFFQAVHGAVWVTYLVKDFRFSPGAIGLLGMSGLLGALAASFTTASIIRRFGNARTMFVAGFGYALGFGLYPFTRPGWGVAFAVAAGMLTCFTIVTMHVIRVSIRQAVCPEHLYGRVGATMEFLVWGIIPVGGLAGGVIATVAGLEPTLWIVAAGIAVSLLWIVLSPLRSARELDLSPAAESAV